MQPCSKNKESIALHAAGALEPSKERVLVDHLAVCGDCRNYFESLRDVARQHVERAEVLPVPAGADSFHRTLRQRIESDEPALRRSRREESHLRSVPSGSPERRQTGYLWHLLTRPGWVWVPAAAAAITLLLVVNRPTPRESPVEPRSIPIAVAPSAPSVKAPDPSLLAYRRAAVESLEVLEELLARDERLLLRHERAATIGLRDVL